MLRCAAPQAQDLHARQFCRGVRHPPQACGADRCGHTAHTHTPTGTHPQAQHHRHKHHWHNTCSMAPTPSTPLGQVHWGRLASQLFLLSQLSQPSQPFQRPHSLRGVGDQRVQNLSQPTASQPSHPPHCATFTQAPPLPFRKHTAGQHMWGMCAHTQAGPP